VLEALLTSEGYEIITANQAKDALHLIEEADLDLIITDMKMPAVSGMELLWKAKKSSRKFRSS